MDATNPTGLSAPILGQLLLMQSVVGNLPDEPSMFSFVCRGLKDLPGVAEARHAAMGQETTEPSWVPFALRVGPSQWGELRLRILDAAAFAPYEAYLKNFCVMLAVILEGRHQRRLNERQQAELDERVQSRTRQLVEKITERKQAEEALRASEERQRAILQTAMDGFWVADMQGHLLEVNETYCRISGYDAKELLAMRITDLDCCETPGETAAHMQKILTLGQDRFESRHRCKDGAIIDVEVSVQYRGSHPGRMVAFLRDITERKQVEEEREKLQMQLTQAQKMELVGRLAGGVAHDFNNMLHAIRGNVSLLLEDIPPESPWRENLNEIDRSAQRSSDLTRQLLAFARKQSIQPKVLDLNDTISGMLKMLRRLIGENIDLVWMPGANVWPVKVDLGQIDQILANLCVNARDAIAGTGNVTIRTSNLTLEEAATASHPDCAPGDYVLLAVSDTGQGMDAATRAHLFEPFFTTKGVGQGTGLGLATVFGIVKQNRGLINVQSEPGQGAIFEIYLPRAEAEAVAAEQHSIHRSSRGQETLLLVEDEPQVLKLAKRILERLGYAVLAAPKPEAALALAAEHAGPIHLLITDVIMPGMDGKKLRDRLQSSHPELKCVFMSGYTADVIAHHGVVNEGLHFLQKPFTGHTLGAKVREVLEATSGSPQA